MADSEKKSSFKSSEICRIIEVCHKSGVSKLTLGDIVIEFVLGQEVTPDLPKAQAPILASQTSGQLSTAESFSVADKQLLEEVRLSQLQIDDPLAFEQEMMDLHMGRDLLDG